MSSPIDNIYKLIYCSVKPIDSLRFNTYFINCFRKGSIIKDIDYEYFEKHYGLYWMSIFEKIDFHNLKIMVSSCCASVGDVVRPYTMLFMGDTIYIFYSTVPLNGYIFTPIDGTNFWFGPFNENPVFIHCFKTIPNTYGIVGYNRNKKATLYLDGRDYMPGC